MRRESVQFCFIITCVLIMAGCAGIEPPMPDKLITHPLGSSPVKLGMTKDEVRDTLGEPDSIIQKGNTDSSGLTTGEEWVYNKWMKDVPINRANLSKNLRLIFDGKNLTAYKEE